MKMEAYSVIKSSDAWFNTSNNYNKANGIQWDVYLREKQYF